MPQQPARPDPQLAIMAHLVLGYPSLAESLRTAALYVQAGVQILELQIPFSHPTADGPVITAACREAVENQHVSIADSLAAMRSIREQYPAQEIIAMSYLNRMFAYGVEPFLNALADINIRHVIVPDLPVDSALAQTAAHQAVKWVPVFAANVTESRLERLLQMDFDFFYLMSDFKITGAGFSLNPRLQQVIRRIRNARPAARIGIGFGISTPEQARLVASEADVAIVGSALIEAQRLGRLETLLEEFRQEIFRRGTGDLRQEA